MFTASFWKRLSWWQVSQVIFWSLVLICVVPMFAWAIWLGVDFELGYSFGIGVLGFILTVFHFSDNPVFKVFFGSKQWRMLAWSGLIALICLLILSVMFAREFADWMFAFGNIMQKGATKVTDWPELIVALLIYIMVPLGIVEVGNGYLTRMIVIAGRVAFMTQNLELWLSSRKYINGAAQTFTDIIRDYMQKVLDYGKTIFRAYGVFCIFGPKLWYMSESFKFQCLPEIPRAFCWLMNLAGSLCYIISIICLSWALISWFASLKLEKSQTINIDNEKMVRHIYEDIEKEKPSPEKKEEVKKEVFSRIGKLKTGYVWYAIHYFTWDLLMNWYGKFWIIAPMFFFGLFVTNLQASYGLMSQALSIANEFHASMIFVAFMWGDFQTYRVLRDNLFSFTKSLESKPYPKDPFRRERRRETAEKAE